MKRSRSTRLFVLLAAGTLCAAATRPALAGDLDWKLSASLNYESGRYGTGTRSSSLYVPFTAKRYWGDWNASLTMPYLSQTSAGQVTNVGGRPFRIRRASGPGAAAASTTRSGPGDALVRGGRALMRDDPQPFDLAAVAKIKIPTADKNDGLGTGEFDEEVGLEAGKLVAPGWTILADLYYTFIGSPPGAHLNDEVAADVGFARPLNRETTLTVLLEESSALVSGEPAPADLSGTLDFKLNRELGAFGGVLLGLSDGSPDYGFRAGGSYRF